MTNVEEGQEGDEGGSTEEPSEPVEGEEVEPTAPVEGTEVTDEREGEQEIAGEDEGERDATEIEEGYQDLDESALEQDMSYEGQGEEGDISYEDHLEGDEQYEAGEEMNQALSQIGEEDNPLNYSQHSQLSSGQNSFIHPDDESEDSSDSEHSDDEHQRIIRDLEQAKQEYEHLSNQFKEREKKILLIKERERQSKKKNTEDKFNGNQPADAKLKLKYYHSTLDDVSLIWDKLEERTEEADEQLDRLTVKLEKEDKKAQQLSQAFRRFKREISRESRWSMNGNPIKFKRILAYEALEEQKDTLVGEVRLKHIMLTNQVKSLENQVKQKDELAEGFHLIDFEQLRIENQTLNEKIEERNDDLHKLRKKTTSTVQVLTHIKEKLCFVEEQNLSLEEQLSELDGTVTNVRARLTKAKQVREALRAENALLKQKQGFIGSDLLVGDFEGRKSTLVEVQAKLEGLQNDYARMAAQVERARIAEMNFARATRHLQQPRASGSHYHARDPRKR